MGVRVIGPCAGFSAINLFIAELVCLKQYAEHPLGYEVQIDEPHGGAGVFLYAAVYPPPRDNGSGSRWHLEK